MEHGRRDARPMVFAHGFGCDQNSGLEVGGDWYDAFWLDDGDTIGLVVGDVVGRGIVTAAVARTLHDPGHVDDVCVLAARLS